jgi:NADPH:quinone reductase-like Zn-dependent oxidoreductase
MRAATGGRGADVVLDMVGGDYTARNLQVLATDGRLVQIAFLKSSQVELDIGLLMRKRLWLTGSTLRPRTPAEKGVIARRLEAEVWPLLASRAVSPVIDAVFPLADAALAHRRMESSAHVGKIVLDVRA